MPERATPLPRWNPGHGRRLLELFILSGFAIAQPILDVTGRAPEFFVFRRVGREDIALFVLLVIALPPLAFWLVEQITRFAGARAQFFVHVAFVALLLASIAVQVGKHLFSDRGYSLGLAGLVIGATAAVVVARSATARLLLYYLSPAPLVFALLFVLTSPSGQLITSSGDQSHASA